MRDKLIELINENRACPEEDGYPCEKCVYDTSPSCFVDRLADVLIANGVTFADVPDTNVGKWIPVSERPPEHGVNVLCMTMFDMRVMHWHESAELWVDDEAAHTKRFVEYWMPIPKDPKEGE